MAAKKQPLELVSTEKDKAKALTTTLEKIGKQFGQGSVMRLGENMQKSASQPHLHAV